MDFQLTEDQKLLLDTVKGFVRKDSPVSRAREHLSGVTEASGEVRDDVVGFDRAVLAKMGDLGWLGVGLPEDVGGFGGRFIDVALMLEVLASTLTPEPLAAAYLGARAVVELGDDAQKARWAAPAVQGETLLTLALAERDHRFAPQPASVRARRDGDAWLLDGDKRWVVAGNAAAAFVVSAAAEGGPLVAVVPRDAAGLTVTAVNTVDGRRAAMLSLAGVRVEADAVLGHGAAARDALDLLADLGAAACCAEGAGVMKAVLDMTTEYLKTRQQFGVKIGTFQALQHRTVDMFVECELARSASLMASLLVDGADDADRRREAVSAATAQVIHGGRWVTQQGIQLHGGIGITHEADVGLYFKRFQVLATLYGDEHYHLGRMIALPTFRAGVDAAGAPASKRDAAGETAA